MLKSETFQCVHVGLHVCDTNIHITISREKCHICELAQANFIARILIYLLLSDGEVNDLFGVGIKT